VVDLEVLDADPVSATSQIIPFPLMSEAVDPERAAAHSQIRQFIERAIDDLPEIFRVVFVMRDVEEMSVEETADFLGLPPATVKTRLHRARRQLRRALDEKLASTLIGAFPFDGQRCQRMTDEVLHRLQLSTLPHG
jgi:RNA polymerase sigma-70 factor (ECF subfamily)